LRLREERVEALETELDELKKEPRMDYSNYNKKSRDPSREDSSLLEDHQARKDRLVSSRGRTNFKLVETPDRRALNESG